MNQMNPEQMISFKQYLTDEERSPSTVRCYLRDISKFSAWAKGAELTKSIVLKYKGWLCENYAPASVNAALAALNCFFRFCGWYDLTVKSLKIQKQLFASSEKELTKTEYERLLCAAKRSKSKSKSKRLYLLMQTICSTGIRVSEVKYITAESVVKNVAEIRCKGKQRRVFLPKQLCRMLTQYMRENKIKSGAVFISKNGNPLDRSNIWSDMKKLCKAANVSENKVFPHNLRHLFARTYYSIQKDIVRLADILGHSGIDTTRIYTMESGATHYEQIQQLGLLGGARSSPAIAHSS